MARDLRYVPPGALVEVTCRTIQGRFLLRPSRELNEIVYGVLGRAVELWPGVGVVAFTFLSSHFHALLVPEDAEALARFMGFVETNLSKEIGRLHDWPGSMWGDRYHSVIVSHEPEAQVERLQYVLSQGVKENLVRRPEEWPGPTSTPQLLHGGPVTGVWFDRSAEYEHRRRLRRKGESRRIDRYEHARKTEFDLAPLPCWAHLSPAKRRRRAAELARQCETEGRCIRQTTGKPVLGVKRILRFHPHHRPQTLARSPRPRFHAVEPAVRAALELIYRKFVDAYRDAAAELVAGRKAHFPAHSFPRPMPFHRGQLARAP